MKKVLITGGAGFIGSHVTRAFLAEGADVTILDNLSSGKKTNVPEGARLIVDDIRSDSSQALVRHEGFDTICHLAAQIDVRKSVSDPAYDADVNLLGSLRLIEAMRGSKKPDARFIFSSTGGALYGDFVLPPAPENSPKDPQSPYGNSKLSLELYLGYYSRVHDVQAISLRYGNVYGPRQDSKGEAGVVAVFCERILTNSQITIFGDGKQTRDYVYAGDVAQANVRAAQFDIPTAGGVDARAYNIGTGIETDVLELVAELKSISGSGVAVKHEPERPGEVKRSGLDISKAEKELGWKPSYSLSRGLNETYFWFKAQAEKLGN